MYAPVLFGSPTVNPAVGGSGVPIAYVSASQYQFAPTSIDTADLVPDGEPLDQVQAAADVLARASAWADRFCFGSDPASKGAALAATVSVESARVQVLGGEIRLVCDYKPILSVTGLDVGFRPDSMSSIGAGSSQLRFGRRTIYVPATAVSAVGRTFAPVQMFAAWSYVNGYPHTSLAAAASAGDTSITVAPTDGGSGVLGVFPGTRLTIVDGAETENVTVTEVSGTTLTVGPLINGHTPAQAPDFTPVTAMPAEVTQAVIFLASALIKTRGDNSLVLSEMTEPHQVKAEAGDEFTDVSLAFKLLAPYRIRVKSPR